MKKVKLVLALAGAGMSSIAMAQESNYRPTVNTDITPFVRGACQSSGCFDLLEGVRTRYSLGLAIGTDSNPGKAPDSSTNPADRKRDATVTNVTGAIDLLLGNPESNLSGRVGASLNSNSFSGGSTDDNTTATIQADGLYRYGTRFDAKATVAYTDGEDPKGSVNDNREVNSYDLTSVGFSMGFGAPGAKGRLEIDVSESRKSYDKDPINFAALSAQDVDKTKVTGRFLYRVAPKTRLFFEASQTENQYDDDLVGGNTQNLDSKDTTVSIGAKWDATAKTSGSVNIGSKSRDFDTQNGAIQRTDTDNSFWDISVNWSPTQTDTVVFTTGSDLGDSFANFGTQETDRYGLTWSKQWLERFSTTVSYNRTEDDFDGFQVAGVPTNRSDETDIFSASANYKMRQWLTLGLSATVEDRTSNLKGATSADNFNYDREIYKATARVVF